MQISVRSFGESLSRALRPRSVSGQTQVSLRSDSGQTQVSLRSVSGQSQVSLNGYGNKTGFKNDDINRKTLPTTFTFMEHDIRVPWV